MCFILLEIIRLIVKLFRMGKDRANSFQRNIFTQQFRDFLKISLLQIFVDNNSCELIRMFWSQLSVYTSLSAFIYLATSWRRAIIHWTVDTRHSWNYHDIHTGQRVIMNTGPVDTSFHVSRRESSRSHVHSSRKLSNGTQ